MSEQKLALDLILNSDHNAYLYQLNFINTIISLIKYLFPYVQSQWCLTFLSPLPAPHSLWYVHFLVNNYQP